MGKLDDKVAIITGASAGLGKQIAKRFVTEGAKVAICARNVSKLELTAKECEELGGEVFFEKVDLCNVDEMDAFVKAIVKRFGTIDILVNNAVSIFPPHPFLEHTLEELDLTMHSGFYATWHMMRLCFPYLKDKASSIVNFSSSAGDLGLEGYAAYAATKEAIRAITRVAANEWGRFGIRANTVSPGAVTDHLMESVVNLPQEVQDLVLSGMRANPMGRAGDPYDDITPVVLFLASDDSRWITGQNLYVTGGATIHA